jgi:DNA-directed RNA polymerase specialized sigma24 family protein
MQLVFKAIRRLPEGDRAALLMRTGGLAYDQIAPALGISVTAAKVRVHRARKRLIGMQEPKETAT